MLTKAASSTVGGRIGDRRNRDELYGDARGDELPEQLRTPEGRSAALAEAKRRIEDRNGCCVGEDDGAGDRVEVDPQR